MNEDFVKKMRKLDDAEELLAACAVRAVIGDYNSHMNINRLILDAARRQVQGRE